MPYNPGVQDRSGQLLGQGIAGFGSGISRGIDKLGDNRRQDKEDERRRMEQIKRMQKVASGLGMSDAQVQESSIGELEGFVDSVALERAAQIQKRDQQKHKMAMEKALMSQRSMDGLNKAMMPMGPQRELTRSHRLAMTGAGTPQGFNTTMDADRLQAEMSKGSWRPSIVDVGGGRKAIMTSPKSANLIKDDDHGLKIPFKGNSFKENGVTWTWDDSKGTYEASVDRKSKVDPLTIIMLRSQGLIDPDTAQKLIKDQYLGSDDDSSGSDSDDLDLSDDDTFFDY